ncbi:hypothetical protein BDA99DRAFT_194111 [Phascolomyces articulosus]|uniref:Uncharacterized protein n=1 Tax=Phascolomyces articulosus TaxID=60185 RepID=A0AAD5PI72_9FUNG|nr:hypothetical protein BDA99DRAFT_194111 [Phascolomyces articulosus]
MISNHNKQTTNSSRQSENQGNSSNDSHKKSPSRTEQRRKKIKPRQRRPRRSSPHRTTTARQQQQPEIIDLTQDSDDPPPQPPPSTLRNEIIITETPIPIVPKSPEPQNAIEVKNPAIRAPQCRSYPPQSKKKKNVNPTLSQALTTFYNGFIERQNAGEYLKKFDELCEYYKEYEHLVDTENLEKRIIEQRSAYQKSMKLCKKDEQDGWLQLYNTLKELSQDCIASYYDYCIQKIEYFNVSLNDYLVNKEQREWTELRCDISDLMRKKQSESQLQRRYEGRKNGIKQQLLQEIDRGCTSLKDEHDTQVQEGNMLCGFIAKQNQNQLAKYALEIGEDVVRGICQQIIEEHRSNEKMQRENALKQIANHLRYQRTNTLRQLIMDQQPHLQKVQGTVEMSHRIREAQKSVKEIEQRCTGDEFETVEKVRSKIENLEVQAQNELKRIKRIRDEQHLALGERKKARLDAIEKRIDELQGMVTQAQQNVLTQDFTLRTKKSINEIYGVLNNHGEFIRHIIDPIAAENGEEIGQGHLGTISTVQDGLTFPLRCSIERLAKNIAENAINDAVERLDILEKKIV